MQTDSSRTARLNDHTQAAKIGRSSVLEQARQAVQNSLDANQQTPARELAEWLMKDQIVASLSAILARDFFLRTIRAERRKRAADAQMRLPGFDHLPLTIQGADGEPVPLMDASYTRVRAYYRRLMVAHRNRRVNDPKIKEVKALLELMRAVNAVTVRQVLVEHR